jgi:hypothetical protein
VRKLIKNDFSLKWFGIPDKVIVKFWKKLEKLPRRKNEYIK